MKALILSAHTGGGHDAAASAVLEALTERGVTCRMMDCFAFGGQWLSKCVCQGYIRWVQVAPSTFGMAYRSSLAMSNNRIKSPVYLFNRTYAFRMQKVLSEFQPDMIVCTHLCAAQAVTHLRRHDMYDGLLAMVMTDYTIHPFTEDVESDLLFIHECAKEECVRLKKLPPESIWCTGIPVSLKCLPCEDKQVAKAALGLPTDRKEVLLVGGSMGAGNLPGMIEQILPALGKDAHLTVVCGSNTRAKEKAEAHYGDDPRVTICGRVSPLTPHIAAADVLVSKSGGLTSTEAMTIGTPMVVARPIAGCETENIRFMEKYGMAAWVRSEEELTEKVAALLEDDTARARMVAAQRKHIDPNAARNIADILISRTNARKEDEHAREA